MLPAHFVGDAGAGQLWAHVAKAPSCAVLPRVEQCAVGYRPRLSTVVSLIAGGAPRQLAALLGSRGPG